MASENSELTDETLVAFADGELPDEDMGRLRPLIEADPEASEKVERYKKSAETLQNFFSADVPDKTPEHIAEKIRNMGNQNQTDNVLSLTSYRSQLFRKLKDASYGAGLQKIAASLFVGVFLGVGGAYQFDISDESVRNVGSELKFRGAGDTRGNITKRGIIFSLLLDRRHVEIGDTIPKNKPFRIKLDPTAPATIGLRYHEPGKPSETLIKNKKINPGASIFIPEDPSEGLSVATEAAFVTFEIRSEHDGTKSTAFYSFGVN